MTALHLSVLSNASKVIDFLFERSLIQQDVSFMYQPKDEAFNLLGCLILQGSFESLMLLERFHDIFLERDSLNMSDTDVNPLLLAVFLGRKNFVLALLQLAESRRYARFFRRFLPDF